MAEKRFLVSRHRLAWVIAAVEIAALLQSVVFWGSSGVWSTPEFAIPGVIAFALVGALIASQRTRNSLGWLLLLTPVPVTINVLLREYADIPALHHVSVPLADLASWFTAWAWSPFGVFFPAITVRFPDGRVPHRWRFVDWLAIAGGIGFAAGLAISSSYLGVDVFVTGPLPSSGGALLVAGLGLTALAMVFAVVSLAERYRYGDRRLRSQLKWFLLAAFVIAVSLVYLAVVEIAFRLPFGLAMEPFTFTLVLIPAAIGVAILHHQLFDIDVILSRTLVYVTLTAVLGGLYIGVIELVQRLFVLYTGETSDMAIVITAFVVAGAFTPLQKSIDGAIERRFGGRDLASRVDGISTAMQSVVRVIDPYRAARWLVDELVATFGAEGGELYLHAHDASLPLHVQGRLTGNGAVEVAIRHEGRELGRLVLGRRRGGAEYSHRDGEALRRAAASLGEALVVAAELGHVAAEGHAAELHLVNR